MAHQIITPCSDRLVAEIATLDCVRATLAAADLSSNMPQRDTSIGSAELVLTESIARLTSIMSDVERLQRRASPVHA